MANQSVQTFRCSYCDAPLDVGPDSVLVVCRYCGKPNVVAGKSEDIGDIALVPTLKSTEIAKRAVGYLGRRASKATFGEPDLYYIPYYFVEAVLDAKYRAKVRVPEGNSYRTVEVSGSLRRDYVVPVVARRAVAAVATDELGGRYISARPQLRPLEEAELGPEEAKAFLAAEFGRSRATAVGLDAAIEELLRDVEKDARRHAGGGANARVVDKTVDYNIEKAETSQLIYLPAWVVPYIYDGSQYAIAVAGWDGSLLAMTEPVSTAKRAGLLAGAAIASGVLGGIGIIWFVPLFFGAAATLSGIIGGLIFMGFGALMAFAFADRAVKSVEVRTPRRR